MQAERARSSLDTADLFLPLCYTFILVPLCQLHSLHFFVNLETYGPVTAPALISFYLHGQKRKASYPAPELKIPGHNQLCGLSQKKRAMLSESWIKEKNMSSGGQKGIEKAEIITNLSNQTEIIWLQILIITHKNDYWSSDKVTIESFLKC